MPLPSNRFVVVSGVPAEQIFYGSEGTPLVINSVTGVQYYLNGSTVTPIPYTNSKAAGTGIKVDIDSPTFGWRDIIGDTQPKATGAGTPSRAVYSGGVIGEYAFIANDICDYGFHIPHDYVLGTDIYLHVHWSHNGTSISGNVVFDLYHQYAKGHNQENFTAEKVVSVTYATVDIATTPRYRHRIDEVIVSGSSATATLMDRNLLEPDGWLPVTLKLNTLPTIGGGGKLFVHNLDVHYQSSNIGTKQKEPEFYV